MTSFFSGLFGKVSSMKDSTEQQEITNKINDIYESIAKGLEELNQKVNSVKELKEKLKNLPPPPPPPPQEKPKDIIDEQNNKENKEENKEGNKEGNNGELPNKVPNVVPEMPKAPIITQPAVPSDTSSPLPMPGGIVNQPTPPGSIASIGGFDGGKKRKLRTRAKRTISKNNNEPKNGKRTRKNKANNKEVTSGGGDANETSTSV